MEVPELCHAILDILVKNAGATKGILILEKEGNLWIESGVSADNVDLLKMEPGNPWIYVDIHI